MQENVAMAMSPVGVHNFSCVLSSIRCTTKVVNSNLRNQLNRGNFEIAPNNLKANRFGKGWGAVISYQ